MVTAKFIPVVQARPGGQGAFPERRLSHHLVNGKRCFKGSFKKKGQTNWAVKDEQEFGLVETEGGACKGYAWGQPEVQWISRLMGDKARIHRVHCVGSLGCEAKEDDRAVKGFE